MGWVTSTRRPPPHSVARWPCSRPLSEVVSCPSPQLVAERVLYEVPSLITMQAVPQVRASTATLASSDALASDQPLGTAYVSFWHPCVTVSSAVSSMVAKRLDPTTK